MADPFSQNLWIVDKIDLSSATGEYNYLLICLVLFQKQPINVDDMGHPIRGPIQRHVGPSCVHQIYILRESIEFHDMQTKCQEINIYHSFISVLLISCHKSLDYLLPDFSKISP